LHYIGDSLHTILCDVASVIHPAKSPSFNAASVIHLAHTSGLVLAAITRSGDNGDYDQNYCRRSDRGRACQTLHTGARAKAWRLLSHAEASLSGRRHSPRHMIVFISRSQGTICMSMTWRVTSARL
jgi:hypothetical protein